MADIRRKVSGGKFVQVGFFGDSQEDGGTPVAYIAAIAEWGNPKNNQPPRPFFRGMIAQNKAGWGAQMARFMKASRCDADLALQYMGQNISNELQASIRTFSGAPISPVTALLRQRFPMRDGMEFSDVLQARHDVKAGEAPDSGVHDKPLIWTGTMLRSVNYEVKAGS